MFTAFPGQSVGIGLLALRASAALWIFGESVDLAAAPLEFPVAAAVLILLFVWGFAVRIAAAAALAIGLYLVADGDSVWSAQLVGHLLELAAIGLLGPGAYSIDAMLFGRRTITLGD